MRIVSFLASAVISVNTWATSVQVQYETVTPENSDHFGISMHLIEDSEYCEYGAELWITAPELSRRAVFSLSDETESFAISGSLLVQTNAAEPVFKQGATYADGSVDEWLKRQQSVYDFLSDGFRGVFLCIRPESLERLKIRFDDRFPNDLITRVWLLEPLTEWLK